MFKKILIANRGEIALRIIRACREMGIQSVAVHSTADASSMAVRLADESVCIGPPQSKDSYLNIPAILTAAAVTGADAIHPGYGFLSENAQFGRMIEEHGFTFIGPDPDHIDKMGDKVTAKKTVMALGLPVVPGSPGAVESVEEGLEICEDAGYPVIIKAASGGGGKGMQVVRSADEFQEAFTTARREAAANFGDDTVYIEKYLEKPRHIEIQVFGDKHGNGIHLGERDCSIQRRHQKLVEEAPSPALPEEEREAIGSLAADVIQKMGYVGVIAEQIRVAAGEPLRVKRDGFRLRGHAIEIRINAEDPDTFIPSPGKIKRFHAPGGMGVRFDSAIYGGYSIPPYYDSMIGKLIVHGRDREQAIRRLKRCIVETVVDGVKTTLPLHDWILSEPDFISGDYDIHWLEKKLAEKNA